MARDIYLVTLIYLNKFHFRQLLVSVDITDGEHLRHGLGHVHIAGVHAELDEEGHHVQQLINADVAITVLVKQFKHLKEENREFNSVCL